MAAWSEEEDAPQLLELFDSFWFQNTVLSYCKKQSNSQEQPSPEEPAKVFDEVHEQLFQKSELLRVPSTLHVRSLSDHALGADLPEVPSPDSVLAGPMLETILSGKEVEFEAEPNCGDPETNHEPKSIPTKQQQKGSEKHKRRRMKKQGSSKSMSELEFEELKGFMDLGFVFSEQDKNSADLVSIIPGLQRLGKGGVEGEGEAKVSEKSSVSRPYLSQAWEILDRRRRTAAAAGPLVNWRVPDLTNEMAVKDQLKFWAHAVASTVR